MAADEKGPSLKASFLNVPASQYQIWTAPVEPAYLPRIFTLGTLLQLLGWESLMLAPP